MKFADGSTYNGLWAYDMFEGEGTMVYSDGSKYTGLWSRGQRHGKGEEITPSGERHVWESLFFFRLCRLSAYVAGALD